MEPINFFKNDSIKFDIGGEFEYKALIAEDELSMDMSYCYSSGQWDVRRYNILRLAHNLIQAPFTIEQIKSFTGKEVEWKILDPEDRIKIILKLSTSMFQKIIAKADSVDYADLELKKN